MPAEFYRFVATVRPVFRKKSEKHRRSHLPASILCYFCIVKIFLATLGSLALVLGIVGIFVPLLPTTPFLLLAAALWVRSSPRLYEWLLTHRCLGEYIRNYRENRAIPLRAKVISLMLMWATMLYCVFVLLTEWWWAQAALLAVAAGVSWHILSFATLKKTGTAKPKEP